MCFLLYSGVSLSLFMYYFQRGNEEEYILNFEVVMLLFLLQLVGYSELYDYLMLKNKDKK